ncbi:hypothetical protein [Campylobacter sp. 19-13652]|uniref:hypothetical protein n=1 Tax=Campylobacter sp. 19-13652 TaxID=2840180 RepID=UPI001C743C76|nr:hypothetical protein [Campylobacter sp. 19-13652]BCX80212.1 hypothetical protein LBC_16740 [Campylobacter sp. 19-13652]
MQTFSKCNTQNLVSLQAQKHTLSSYYGYGFEYDRLSLKSADITEVELGLLRVAVSIDEFLKIAHLDASESMTKELAVKIKSMLPVSKCAEHQKMIFSKVLALFDRLISQNGISPLALKGANILFRKFINLQNRFAFCA